MEKVDGPATVLVFLGLILDSLRPEIRLLPEKLQDLLQELTIWLAKCSTTKRELMSLIKPQPPREVWGHALKF